MQGLIIENIANLYKIENREKDKSKKNSQKEIYEAYARGKFKKEEITPVVGDFVEFEITDLENKKAVINQIAERKVYIKRPKMANITQLILVVSSKDPKPDLLMLDKQLAFSEFLDLKVCIVLNKIDLDDEKEFKNIKEIYTKIGYEVIETQANKRNEQKNEELSKQAIEEDESIDDLILKLKGNINVLAGNSGVGKSTLINAIFKKELTQEGEISNRNKRGKNTTTSTKLYEIEENTYIADTPGFSTFSIEEIPSNRLVEYFKEFRNEIQNCEFASSCTHIKEENCGIKQAVKEGKISQDRYDRFCKIYEELKQKEERKKW